MTVADPIAQPRDAQRMAEALLMSCLSWQSPDLWPTLSEIQQFRVLKGREMAEHYLRLGGLEQRCRALVLSAELAREIGQ